VYCPLCRSDYADDWKVCPKDAATLLRSRFIGKYRLDELLGTGGMGSVFRAYNPDTQSAVAIKLMHQDATANEAARQRFQREAAAVAALRTRHVVTMYDFGADEDDTLYLVMELLRGHPVRAEIAPLPEPMPLPRVNLIVEQALRGLGAAHRAGIVHRDLKPENLFVADTDDGEVVKLLDFGVARVSRGDTPNLTHSGAIMGTPAYMAPEQVAGSRGQVGRHSDVYSIGVIVYEMLTGIQPFAADTLPEVLSKILSRSFAALPELRPDLPLALAQLADRALADDPAQRYCTADAMREAWTVAWAQLPPARRDAPVPPFGVRAEPVRAPDALAPTAAATTAHPVEPARRRSWAVLAGVAVAGGGAAIVLAVQLARRTAAPAPRVVVIDAAPLAPDAAPPAGMVRFAGGRFAMGAAPAQATQVPYAEPLHEVTIAPFLLDAREVTDDAGALPRRSITWTEADGWCRAHGKRLPTAAEWDFAARSAPLRLDAKHAAPEPVGSHPADCTPDGVCDLLGNVMEWTADDWPGDPTRKIVRGASYAVSPAAGWYATIHARLPLAPEVADAEVGFRCAEDAP